MDVAQMDWPRLKAQNLKDAKRLHPVKTPYGAAALILFIQHMVPMKKAAACPPNLDVAPITLKRQQVEFEFLSHKKKTYFGNLFPSWCTPPNFRVCARWNVPAKRFKICHILYIQKPKVAFSIFHFVLLYFFPNECSGLCRHRPGHSFGTLGFRVI